MFKAIECAHDAHCKLGIRIKAFVLIVPKFVRSRSALRGSADTIVNTADVSVCAAGSAAAVLVHRRLMTADGRMFVVMCEWAAEQRDVISGGSRRSSACGRTLGVAYEQFPSEHPEIGLTGASEHWRSESDCSCNFTYLICFPLHLSLLNAHSSES